MAFSIRDQQITESSGLAADPGNGVYWTVNDSGDGAVVYGLDPDGDLRGTLRYRATPRDVEAVAVDADVRRAAHGVGRRLAAQRHRDRGGADEQHHESRHQPAQRATRRTNHGAPSPADIVGPREGRRGVSPTPAG